MTNWEKKSSFSGAFFDMAGHRPTWTGPDKLGGLVPYRFPVYKKLTGCVFSGFEYQGSVAFFVYYQ